MSFQNRLGIIKNADIVFLDEIWKAGPAILNTLLTVINERTFKNGQQIHQIPMRLLITASNELPEPDSGLEALYDRMLIRVFVDPIQEKKNFRAMLMGERKLAVLPPELAIKHDEFKLWQSEINSVKLTEPLFEKIYQLKELIEAAEQSDETASKLYVSDRRWKKSVRLLKACAYFNGRNEINPLDLLILKDCLWHNPISRQTIYSIIHNFTISSLFDQQSSDLKIIQSEQSLSNANKQMLESLALPLDIEITRRKDWFKLDISDAKRFNINNNSRMVKLALLQVNPSVSETQEGDSEWVYVDGEELVKKIRPGKCEIYGFINRHQKLSALQFEVDAQQQLIIKDISNRNINASLVKEDKAALADLPDWQQSIESAQKTLHEAEHALTQSRIQFHSALPHNFLDESISVEIDNSFRESLDKIEQLRSQVETGSQRILSLAKYFE